MFCEENSEISSSTLVSEVSDVPSPKVIRIISFPPNELLSERGGERAACLAFSSL